MISHHSVKNKTRLTTSNIKSFTMTSSNFFLVLYLLEYSLHYVESNSCANFDTQNVLNTQIGCELHSTPIDLNEYRHNITDQAIHLIPDVAMVNRCGGNCLRPSHRCVPRTKRIKSIPVMAILSRFPHGAHDQQCGHIQVEEHTDCDCNCPITEEQCISQPGVSKRFYEATCRCICTDTFARRQCISSNKNWDEQNCRCVCPISSWTFCSTGYVFDYENSCTCIPTSMTASLGLIAAIIVLITCMIGTTIGGFIMYRKQTGIFRKRRAFLQDRKPDPLLAESFKGENNGKENSFIIRGLTTAP